jgi:hypothetical protein
MIRTDKQGKSTLKEMRERERLEKELALKAQCEALAIERHGEKTIKQWSNQNKGLWYLPVMDESEEKIDKMVIFKPIDRSILSYASTKIEDEGLYTFLEQCMRECYVAGDMEIIDEEEYFIPAAMKFNKILEGKKAALLKR